MIKHVDYRRPMTRRTLVVAAFTLGFAVFVPFANATTVAECTQAITIVKGDLSGITIGGGNPDRTRESLVSKLDGAILKLQEGKFSDALQKLTDFQNKISDLVTQGKISNGDMTTAQQLQADTQDAINCVSTLAAGG